MASALDAKQVDALIEKYRATAAREQRRVDELERRNENVVQEICTSLIVPASAFGMSYARGYYGEKASIWGIPIDAAVGLFLHGLAACFGISVDKGAQRVGKLFHDIANGALASWTAALGAEFGAKKRMEQPAPAPQPNTGADGSTQKAKMHAPSPMTFEEIAAVTAAMALNTKPAMPERLPAPLRVHAPPPAPPPMPVQQMANPSPRVESATAKVPAPAPVPQSALPPQSPLNAQPAPAVSPTPRSKPYRFTQTWPVNPEAEMRALLQSVGAPSDPNTVAHLLSHEKPEEEFRAVVRRARTPA